MGLPLKVAVACSEATIALGDAAATYLSAGLRLDFLVSTQVGAALGGFSGGAGCGVCEGAGGAAGGFGGFVFCAG